MKKSLFALSCLSLMSATAQADIVGLYLGGEAWNYSAKGEFGESTTMESFNLKDQTPGSYFIAVEHPIPLIPNARIRSTTIDTEGSTELTADFDFGGETFSKGAAADTTLDVSYIDYTLYYEILDTDQLSVDLGVTARNFDGSVSVMAEGTSTDPDGNPVTTTLTGTKDLSDFVPMMYARTHVGLPFTGVKLFAEGNFLSIDDHVMYDYIAGVSYDLIDTTVVDLNITGGYRVVKLELEDLDGFYTNLDFDGVFAGVVLHF